MKKYLQSNKIFNTYENHQFHEIDKTNLIKSGRVWFGDYFDIVSGLKKTFSFTHNAKVSEKKIHFKAKFGVRSLKSSGNNIIVKNEGSTINQTTNIGNVASNFSLPDEGSGYFPLQIRVLRDTKLHAVANGNV